MGESIVLSAETRTFSNGYGYLDLPVPSGNGSSSSSPSSIVQRKIDFHPARKPFNGFSNGGGDFRLETLNQSSDSKRPILNQGQSAKAERRPDGSEFLENGLDPDLSLGIAVRKIGAGLENLGNTCFLNSVLQCLTHTEPLAAYLQSGKHQNSCKVSGFCALCAIQRHVSRALQSTGRILAPKDLVSNLRCISRNFRNARQEDAHEYMVNLLESMHKCCLPSGVPSESPSAYDRSLVHKIFGGRLRSQVKCMQCNYCSNTFDPFLDLSLEIAKADSLHKALANFTAAEQLDGGEKQYQCQKCRQKVRASKQLTVHKAPYVLTIHLKRFRAYNPGQKIDKKVQFGPTLDLKPFVSDSYEGDLKYTLYGVLVHCGFSTHSGHYYSFVRTSGGTWYNLDDNRVAAVGERTVLEQKAYMLFYVRDRRNNAPRKPVEAVQKENMKGNNGGNTAIFTSKREENISNGSVQNGIVNMNSNGVSCSAAQTQKDKKDALIAPSTKQSYNEGPVQPGIVDSTQKDALTVDSTEKCPMETTAEDSLLSKACESGQRLALDASMERLGSSNMTIESSNKEAHSYGSKRKIRKKLLKFQIASMRLGPNILFSLGKKIKKRKRRDLDSKKPCKNQFFASEFISCDLGPSTSDETLQISLRATHAKKRAAKSASKRVHKDENFSGQIGQSEAVLAADKVSVKGSSPSVEGQSSWMGSDGAKDSERETMQNGIMSMLTQGLMETYVPRWDGVDLPTPHITARSRSSESVNIGFVGDEWDEEYDRGKKKKVKTFKHSFDGPNLFQEIAMKKTQSKKPRVDQSTSGNLPFRI